ncbi:MAG: hypothetical protein P1V20_15875 [Verrucomicrobiales bacterium]|nr:hypothetical protein [Verrucomicrobiales bacterium]
MRILAKVAAIDVMEMGADNSEKRLLIIPVEVKAREYRARLLIALYAVSLGCRVVLGGQKPLWQVVNQFEGGLYYDKSMAVFYKEVFDFDKILYAACDEEGLATQVRTWMYLNFRHSNEMFEIAKCFLCWGECEKGHLANSYNEYQDKLEVVGNPRVDFWTANHNGLFDRDIAEGYRQKHGKFILVSSNFPSVRHPHAKVLGRKQFRRKGMYDSEEGRKILAGRHEFFKKSLAKMDNLLKRLSREFPGTKIIIRPHPGDWLETWQEVYKDRDNVEVIFEGDICPWIVASEVLIHSSCTSGIEAALMGQKVMAYRSVDGYDFSDFLSNRLGFVARTEDEAVNYIASVLDGTDTNSCFFDKTCEELAPYISYIGDRAYEKVVNRLLAIDEWQPCGFTFSKLEKVENIPKGCRAWPAYQKFKYFGYWLKWKGNPPKSNLKFDQITEHEMKDTIDEICRFTDLKFSGKIEKLEDSVFLLE